MIEVLKNYIHFDLPAIRNVLEIGNTETKLDKPLTILVEIKAGYFQRQTVFNIKAKSTNEFVSVHNHLKTHI